MTCAAGQTDINSASINALMRALAVDKPTASRVVSFRPYLKPSDLLVVQGIGPDRLAGILASGRTCAVPATAPPPSEDVCTGTLLDLQVATPETIAKTLGVSGSVARNIAAARPYSTLRHVTPERVPGLGKGTLPAVSAKTCLTPAPVRTATATFRWAYRSQNTTVTRDTASLTVPAGVVDGAGAWASITDATSTIAIDGPTANFHIWGDWVGGADSVEITLPLSRDQAALPADLFAPVLFHITDAGPVIAHGDSVAVTDSSISTWTTSLSLFTSGPFGVSLLTNLAPHIGVHSAVNSAMRAVTGTRADQPSCHDDLEAWRLETGGNAIEQDFVMGRQPLRYCTQAGTGDSAQWVLANNTGAVVSVNAQGASRVVDSGPSGNLLLDVAYDVWNNTTGPQETTSMVQADIPPGGSITIQAPAGTNADYVGVGTNEVFAVPTFLLRELGLVVPAGKVMDVYSTLQDCAYAAGANGFPLELSNSQWITLLNCAKAALLAGGETVAKASVSVALVVADVMISGSDTLRVSTGSPWDLRLTYRAPAPPVPPTQPGTGTIPPPGEPGAASLRILKLADSPASYVLDADAVTHHIPNTGTYLCNSNVMPVQYGLTPEQFAAIASGGMGKDAACPDAAARSLQPSTTRNFLLRRSDGSSYLVNNYGQKALVIGTGSFDCFAESYLVWDHVSADELARFPNEPSIAGRICSRN